jgi:hypothetical protein
MYGLSQPKRRFGGENLEERKMMISEHEDMDGMSCCLGFFCSFMSMVYTSDQAVSFSYICLFAHCVMLSSRFTRNHCPMSHTSPDACGLNADRNS